jgi:predicted nucleic acid-binding protein
MLFDTDIFIWAQRGNSKAAKLIENTDERFISIISYMELLQGAQNKKQQMIVKDFISDFEFTILSLTENIGHRASIYMEEYSLSHGLYTNDTLIAATAVENNIVLTSSNAKHFRPIRDLKFKGFTI